MEAWNMDESSISYNVRICICTHQIHLKDKPIKFPANDPRGVNQSKAYIDARYDHQASDCDLCIKAIL